MSVQPQSEASETPETFLENLSSHLTHGEDVDKDLAKILTDHILVANPTKDAVAKARSAIIKLAQTRAALPPKAEVANG